MIAGAAFYPLPRPGFNPMESLPIIDVLHPGGSRNSMANDGINH
ncbi:MAG: hypothetical protein ACI8XO_001396 [Verrucomicrobiales bacterium]|jgi:hypothetical protein